jgi:hypothetical protein
MDLTHLSNFIQEQTNLLISNTIILINDLIIFMNVQSVILSQYYHETYEETFNYYFDIGTIFIKTHWMVLLISLIGIVMITMLYTILSRQNKMISSLQNTEAIELLRLRTKIHLLQEEKEVLENELIEKDNQLAFYRKLRYGMTGGFCKVKGPASSREFRGIMKEVEGEYMGKGTYLVRMKYANKFDRNKVIL